MAQRHMSINYPSFIWHWNYKEECCMQKIESWIHFCHVSINYVNDAVASVINQEGTKLVTWPFICPMGQWKTNSPHNHESVNRCQRHNFGPINKIPMVWCQRPTHSTQLSQLLPDVNDDSQLLRKMTETLKRGSGHDDAHSSPDVDFRSWSPGRPELQGVRESIYLMRQGGWTVGWTVENLGWR